MDIFTKHIMYLFALTSTSRQLYTICTPTSNASTPQPLRRLFVHGIHGTTEYTKRPVAWPVAVQHPPSPPTVLRSMAPPTGAARRGERDGAQLYPRTIALNPDLPFSVQCTFNI